MSGNQLSVSGTSQTKGRAAIGIVIDEKFASDFAKASKPDRLNFLHKLSTHQKETLAKLLIETVNDPKRSDYDGQTKKPHPSMMETSPNGNKIELSVAALKTISEDSPKIVLTIVKNALHKKTSNDKVKMDYVRVLDYLAQKKPAFKNEVLIVLKDFVKGKSLTPDSSAAQAHEAIDKLEGKTGKIYED